MKSPSTITTFVAVLFTMGCAVGDTRSGLFDAPGRSSTSPDGGGAPPDAQGGFFEASIGEPRAPVPDAELCSHTLMATFRDFSNSHPDFEVYAGTTAFEGLVRKQLGQDRKPVYAHDGPTQQTAGPTFFAQWYNDVPGVNLTFEKTIVLVEVRPGVYGYGGPGFFPLDGMGFGDSGRDAAGVNHNFHFTSEVHTVFPYGGGEVFTFQGDDDMWLFVNGQLAIDLGGLHPELTFELDLDEAANRLGLQVGHTYSMDIFHAERHTQASNFYLETTIECFRPPPVPK